MTFFHDTQASMFIMTFITVMMAMSFVILSSRLLRRNNAPSVTEQVPPQTKPESTPDSLKVILEFSPGAAARLDELKQEIGVERDGQVISRALALLDYVNAAKRPGDHLVLLGPDGLPKEKIVGISII